MNIHRNRHANEANRSTAQRIISNLDKFKLHESCEVVDESQFDKDVTLFLKFMFTANQRMPGPKHPAVKFYRIRQNRKKCVTSAQYARSSNPQRTDKKTKQRRRDKYQYDLTQYWFYNQRRKAVLNVMKNGKSRRCEIEMDVLENHFKAVFEKPNRNVREIYHLSSTKKDILLTPDDIDKQIKRVAYDTSAGPDRVLARSLRQLAVSHSIS